MREGRTQLFPLGRVSATHSARQAMLHLGIGPDAFVERHRRRDWGNVNAALVRENAVALKGGFRLLSAYGIGGEIFYVITEADRSSTTIFLHEYY